ncbi:LysR family transcriptional regulator [Amphibacillus cookii]|uniref:LysR family transcriptional regulator n=1 Tax=Amphibacillus cookii TaxID=767787 RepID=UPI00195A9BEF|nr:LysR family transcriptional regulator [Amphibacillus cookii]MBM7542323.1 DNA-binding transcriptional LysR family regulator [Amphibacillus cookii]
MDIAELKCFLKVCQTKNLTRAAKELFITQQALSRTINNIEKQLGILLFYRNSRGVTLTEFGEYFYEKAENIIEQFDAFQMDIYAKMAGDKSKLKIGFSPGTLRILGIEDIINLARDYMGINLDIFEYVDKVCESNVLEGTLDMAITVNPSNEADFSYFPLMKHQLVAVVNKANPISKKESLTFTDLKNEQLILIDDTFRMPQVVHKHFQAEGVTPRVYSKLSHDLNLAYDFVSLNKGVFIFIGSLTDIKQYNTIVSIPIDVETAVWEVGFVVRKDMKVDQTIISFMHLIQTSYR